MNTEVSPGLRLFKRTNPTCLGDVVHFGLCYSASWRWSLPLQWWISPCMSFLKSPLVQNNSLALKALTVFWGKNTKTWPQPRRKFSIFSIQENYHCIKCCTVTIRVWGHSASLWVKTCQCQTNDQLQDLKSFGERCGNIHSSSSSYCSALCLFNIDMDRVFV